MIQNQQIHLKNEALESILAPKSIHMAARNAKIELNAQSGTLGGAYDDLVNPGDYSRQRHEIPCCDAYNKVKGLEPGKRKSLPAISMEAKDHRLTASCGNSTDAQIYRETQAKLIAKNNMTAAIQMDIDDIHLKFGSKYDEAIRQALIYAIKEGWWNPWTENTGLLSQLLMSVNLSLDEILP